MHISTDLKRPLSECQAIFKQIQKTNKQNNEPSENKSDEQKESESISVEKDESKPNARPWTEEEDRLLFELYKVKGSVWSAIAKNFNGRTENNLKNRFYSTLRRIARKKTKGLTNAELISKINQNILDYVDEALESGHTCFSKRGRPKKVIRNAEKSEKNKEVKVEVVAPAPQPIPYNPPISALPSPPILNAQRFPSEERALDLMMESLIPPKTKSDVELNKKLVELINLQQTIIGMLLSRSGQPKTGPIFQYPFSNNVNNT